MAIWAVDVAAATIQQQADPAPGEKDGENTPRCSAPIFQVGSFKRRSGAAVPFTTCTRQRRRRRQRSYKGIRRDRYSQRHFLNAAASRHCCPKAKSGRKRLERGKRASPTPGRSAAAKKEMLPSKTKGGSLPFPSPPGKQASSAFPGRALEGRKERAAFCPVPGSAAGLASPRRRLCRSGLWLIAPRRFCRSSRSGGGGKLRKGVRAWLTSATPAGRRAPSGQWGRGRASQETL